jgi:predicted metal-dependent hydrolase
MATKTIELAGVGPITLVKRAQSRNLRLSVTSSGIRVSMPQWTPFSAGQAFALSNIDWIQRELARQSVTVLESGQRIGKLHYLRFEHVLGDQPLTSRVTGTEIVVRLRANELSSDADVQARALTAARRALKREAETLLPPRLRGLAAKHGRDYASVSVKQLKRRWGSCDSHQNIVLNLYLMELPWEHIDYVLLHELTHTVEMNHGPRFWELLSSMEPYARDLARRLRQHQPSIGTWGSDLA